MATDRIGRNIMTNNMHNLTDADIYSNAAVRDSLREQLGLLNDYKDIFGDSNKTELEKLTDYLDKKDIPYEYTDINSVKIIHPMVQNPPSWYHGIVTMEEDGKLSVTDRLANGVKDKGLTAKEVIDRIEGRGRKLTKTINDDDGRGGPGSGGAGGAGAAGCSCVVEKKLQAYAENRQPVQKKEPVGKHYMDR